MGWQMGQEDGCLGGVELPCFPCSLRAMRPTELGPSRAFVQRVVDELREDRRNAWMFLGATLLSAIAHGVLSTCAGLLGQALMGRQLASFSALVDPRGAIDHPIFLSSVGFGAALLKAGAGAFSTYGQKRIAFQVGNVVRRDLTSAIVREGQPAAAAVTSHAAITVRIRDIERGVDEGVLSGFRAAAHLVPLLVALVALSSKLALVALGLLAPFALLLGGTRRFVRGHHARSLRLAEELHARVDALVRQLDLWRTYGAAGRVQEALARAGEEAGRAAAEAEATRSALSGANEVLAAAALLATVALVERGNVDLGGGSLVAFAAVFFLTYRPLRDLGDARTAIERGAASLVALEASAPAWGRLGAVPSEPMGVKKTLRRFERGRLDVEAARFGPNGEAAKGTTMRAEPGEIVVLVGPTGSGKTTFLRGLLGLLPMTEGRIVYDGQDLSGAGVGPSERPFAWVPQEPAIVPGTIEENVALGATGVSPEDIAGALARVGGLELAKARRDAALSAGGHELSGGERQIVALARALVSEQPVLLLDEPTSGLDPEAEVRVLEALEKQRGSRTILLVTHRPAPLAIADRVVSFGVLPSEISELVRKNGNGRRADRERGDPAQN